jgi:CBS-domain-containing membrane protein
MTSHHVTSLPVTGAERQLIGIVNRRDLLSAFLRQGPGTAWPFCIPGELRTEVLGCW